MTEGADSEYREQRIAKMRKLQDLGYNAFGGRFDRSGTLAEIRRDFREDEHVSAAGRVVTMRDMGKSVFADIRDGSDRFQIYAQKNRLGEDAFKAFKLVDAGDHIGVAGSLFTTRTGERTIAMERWELLCKSVRPLPEKWHGLRDVEARYRQRYLDLVANPEVKEIFRKRALAVREIRNYLFDRGFYEVETPMMQPQAGGAAAKPFMTHYAALGADMYLRVAPELYLKRLLVGGMDRIFELNRNFRNEGISRTHNPEFTMLEVYEAYTDVNGMKELVQGLIEHVAKTVFGTLQVGSEKSPIDLSAAWRTVTYRDLILKKAGEDWFDLSGTDARERAAGMGLTVDAEWNMTLLTHEVYEKTIERALVQPTFVTRFPAALIPLARPCADDPSLADVFELVMAGQEIAPAYTELNDPDEQRKRLSEQVGHELERVDEDFLAALEYGMPPAGGMGVGIDRLMMVLSGSGSIRDVILFPQLRQKAAD